MFTISNPLTREQFYRPSQAAQLLGVSAESVRVWCRRGKIPAQRTPGGAYLIPARTVDTLRRALRESKGLAVNDVIRNTQKELMQ